MSFSQKEGEKGDDYNDNMFVCVCVGKDYLGVRNGSLTEEGTKEG